MQETHGEQHEVRRDTELASRDRLHLPIEADAFELLDLAVLADEAAGRHAEVARGTFSLAR